jgi:CheY-like chemotaxis protein
MKQATVLVIDAEHWVRVRLRRLLEDSGYRVSTATSGRDALAALRTLDPLPALILVDLYLPPADGKDLLTVLGGRPGWAAIPVVLLTTADLQADPRSLAVVRKDADDDSVLRVVRRYCLA